MTKKVKTKNRHGSYVKKKKEKRRKKKVIKCRAHAKAKSTLF